jgi:hypothetical protein
VNGGKPEGRLLPRNPQSGTAMLRHWMAALQSKRDPSLARQNAPRLCRDDNQNRSAEQSNDNTMLARLNETLHSAEDLGVALNAALAERSGYERVAKE